MACGSLSAKALACLRELLVLHSELGFAPVARNCPLRSSRLRRSRLLRSDRVLWRPTFQVKPSKCGCCALVSCSGALMLGVSVLPRLSWLLRGLLIGSSIGAKEEDLLFSRLDPLEEEWRV